MTILFRVKLCRVRFVQRITIVSNACRFYGNGQPNGLTEFTMDKILSLRAMSDKINVIKLILKLSSVGIIPHWHYVVMTRNNCILKFLSFCQHIRFKMFFFNFEKEKHWHYCDTKNFLFTPFVNTVISCYMC